MKQANILACYKHVLANVLYNPVMMSITKSSATEYSADIILTLIMRMIKI